MLLKHPADKLLKQPLAIIGPDRVHRYFSTCTVGTIQYHMPHKPDVLVNVATG